MHRRTSRYVNAHDISLRLIAFVADRLQESHRRPTQYEIGRVLKVSQPFVHAILCKGQSLGEDKFAAYARRQNLDIEDLVALLLNIDLEKSLLASLVKKFPNSTYFWRWSEPLSNQRESILGKKAVAEPNKGRE
jgi:hypothetical protein